MVCGMYHTWYTWYMWEGQRPGSQSEPNRGKAVTFRASLRYHAG